MNKIQKAYQQGLRIKQINWCSDAWIKKLTITKSIDENGRIWGNSEIDFDFDDFPENWKILNEDLHLFDLQFDIKQQIQTHLNQIQELLKQL